MPTFTNARLVGRDWDPASYHEQAVPRGHPDYVLGRSDLMEFDRCPHRWVAGVQMEDTKSTDWGQLIDTLVLTPKEFDARFAVQPATYPDSKTGEQKPWAPNATYCKQWKATARMDGKIVIAAAPKLDAEGEEILKGARSPSLSEAKRAIEILMADARCKDFIACSQRQVYITAAYKDKATGLTIQVKTLIDLEPAADHPLYGKCLGDLKTAMSAAPGKWPFVCDDRRYHVQAAMSLDLYMAAVPDADRMDFRHIIQENEPPYEVGRRYLSQEFIEVGRMLYRSALERYCWCLKNKIWPGYDDEGETLIAGWQAVQPTQRMIDQAANAMGARRPETVAPPPTQTDDITP